MAALNINGKEHSVEAPPEMPLLWVLRDLVGLTGTKYGCGIGECGACFVHVGGKAMKSCRVTFEEASGHDITTIEGISDVHPVVKAFTQLNVPACGYCTPGQIMQAIGLLKQHPDPEDDEIVEAMSAVLCRCGAYGRIIAAIRAAAGASR